MTEHEYPEPTPEEFMHDYMTITEFAEYKGIRRNTLYQQIQRGKWPAVRKHWGRLVLPRDAKMVDRRSMFEEVEEASNDVRTKNND